MSVNGEAVLERMGLNGGAIRNVMMHRDLVPRAFACDYTLVSDLLARVSDSFKNLESLHGTHRKVHLGWQINNVHCWSFGPIEGSRYNSLKA